MRLKKRRERSQLDRLLERVEELGVCAVEERERPDFALRFSHRVVGVELTQLYRPTQEGTVPHQVGEANRQHVARLVQRSLNRTGARGLAVTMFFCSGFSPSQSTVERVAADIAQFVVATVSKAKGDVEIEYGPECDVLPLGLERMVVRHVPEFDDCYCSAPDGGFVPALTAEMLQTAIGVKEAKLTQYEQSFAEQWLVIVVDSIAYATWYTPSREVLDVTYRTDFDRIFVLWEISGYVEELHCARSA